MVMVVVGQTELVLILQVLFILLDAKCRVVLVVPANTTFVMVVVIVKMMLLARAVVIKIRHLNGIALAVVGAHGKLAALLDHALHGLEVGWVIEAISVVLVLDLTNTILTSAD